MVAENRAKRAVKDITAEEGMRMSRLMVMEESCIDWSFYAIVGKKQIGGKKRRKEGCCKHNCFTEHFSTELRNSKLRFAKAKVKEIAIVKISKDKRTRHRGFVEFELILRKYIPVK